MQTKKWEFEDEIGSSEELVDLMKLQKKEA